MTLTLEELELHRNRWRRARQLLRLTEIEADDFAMGALAEWGPTVRARLVILPGDSDVYRLDFDSGYWEWWMQNRPDPISGGTTDWGLDKRPSPEAGFRFSSAGRDEYYRYLGLWHHGGLDMGLARDGAREWKESLVFFLISIVGRVWCALDLYRDVIEQFQVPGPFEVTLALRGTENALLGNFANGWAEPMSEWPEPRRCQEKGLLLRREFVVWPEKDAIQQAAFSLGGQIEDAWGREQRRFLARNGPLAGQFDHSAYRWS